MSQKIIEYMKDVYQFYRTIVCADKPSTVESVGHIWDIVVLTAFDELQKMCFQQQLDELFTDGNIFKDRFCVIPDPPDQKLGCGGSTLHVLKTLVEESGPSIYSKKILIIHSGGSSQRLPSYSIQGKLFSPLPIKDFVTGDRVSHMIDLKLALYLPFCKLLGPGVFVTCADDIETYYLDDKLIDKEKLRSVDVVALAHPCDLDTATGHGVYVVPELSVKSGKSVIVSECLEVLQKPSKSVMKDKNAIISKDISGEEMVYSDSVFWMSERVCRPLLSWYMNNIPISLELDAYAHFLPCFGINARRYSYDHLTSYQSVLYPILKDFGFQLIVLNDSRFYHLGSMEEYLYHFTTYENFLNELCLVRNTSNVKLPHQISAANTSLIYSYCEPQLSDISVTDNSVLVVEWCHIGIPIAVNGKTILSNCKLRSCDAVKLLQRRITLPSGFLFHTAPVTHKGATYYVTVAFEIESDMKRMYSDIYTLHIASVPFKRILQIMEKCEKDFICDDKSFTLFSVRLFQSARSAEESFFRTLYLIDSILSWRDGLPHQCEVPLDNNPIFSMKDVVLEKNLPRFLSDRKDLLCLLQS